MKPNHRTWLTVAITAALLGAPLAGCSGGEATDDASLEQTLQSGERYSSAQVQGATARINLDEVRKAFETTQGNDMNTWMSAFERRVNEIYEGSETVAIDAARNAGKVVVAGYVDKNGTGGFQKGDDRLFVIEQTGAAANNQVPYRVANHDGQTHYEGTSAFGGMGGFMMGMMAGQLLSNFGGYHTPRSHYSHLNSYRSSYRSTPRYQAQVRENKAFATRFKAKSTGGVQSNRSFGSGGLTQGGSSSGSAPKRSWGGWGRSSSGTSADSSTSSTSSSGWGGRRRSSSSAESGSSSSSSSGWGGRRSSSSSSSSRRSRRR